MADVIPYRRPGTKYIGEACCGKARLASFTSEANEHVIVVACPDHPAQFIVDGVLEPMEVVFDSKVWVNQG